MDFYPLWLGLPHQVKGHMNCTHHYQKLYSKFFFGLLHQTLLSIFKSKHSNWIVYDKVSNWYSRTVTNCIYNTGILMVTLYLCSTRLYVLTHYLLTMEIIVYEFTICMYWSIWIMQYHLLSTGLYQQTICIVFGIMIINTQFL